MKMAEMGKLKKNTFLFVLITQINDNVPQNYSFIRSSNPLL